MMLPKILVPVAAFALTVTGASAFTGGAWMSELSANDLGVSESQKSALEEAFTIRQEAHENAQTIIKDAGITDEQMKTIHEAVRDARKEHREAVREAVEENDYSAFQNAVAGTPLADTINTQEKFNKFVEAHELMEEGDRDGARTILDELGVGPKGGRGGEFGRMGGMGGMGGMHQGHGGDRDADDSSTDN